MCCVFDISRRFAAYFHTVALTCSPVTLHLNKLSVFHPLPLGVGHVMRYDD